MRSHASERLNFWCATFVTFQAFSTMSKMEGSLTPRLRAFSHIRLFCRTYATMSSPLYFRAMTFAISFAWGNSPTTSPGSKHIANRFGRGSNANAKSRRIGTLSGCGTRTSTTGSEITWCVRSALYWGTGRGVASGVTMGREIVILRLQVSAFIGKITSRDIDSGSECFNKARAWVGIWPSLITSISIVSGSGLVSRAGAFFTL